MKTRTPSPRSSSPLPDGTPLNQLTAAIRLTPSLAILALLSTLAACTPPLHGQGSLVEPEAPGTVLAASASQPLPTLTRFEGTLPEAARKRIALRLSVYDAESASTPLWQEVQNVETDGQGRFAVLLGAGSAAGLPRDLFLSGLPRWLGFAQVGGETEATAGKRILLTSVPYAMKSADAETLAGKAAESFVTQDQLSGALAALTVPAPAKATSNVASPVLGTGTANTIPLWTGAAALGNSALTQTGTGSAARVGLNISAPTALLDVNGGSVFRSLVNLHGVSATAAAGVNSPALAFQANAYSSSKAAAVLQNFQWQAVASGNNTANPTANLQLLFGADSATPKSTGLSIAPSGVITFAPGQSFPSSATTFPKGATFSSTATTGATIGVNATGGGDGINVTTTTNGNAVISTASNGYAGLFTNSSLFQASVYAANKGQGNAGYFTSNGSARVSLAGVNTSTNPGAVATYGYASAGYGLYGVSTSGSGVYGASTSGEAAHFTSANAVLFSGGGITLNSGAAVYGENTLPGGTSSSGVLGLSTDGFGVIGQSTNGSGVYGFSSAGPALDGYSPNGDGLSVTSNAGNGADVETYSAGAWALQATNSGSGALVSLGVGAVGVQSQTGNSYAGDFVNKSAAFPTLFLQNLGNGPTTREAPLLLAAGPSGSCGIANSGDLHCTGAVKALVPTSGDRMVETYSVQSTENWIEDFGSAELKNGAGIVQLDPVFAGAISSEAGYHVYLTPNGDSKGLYTIHKTGTSFEVRESSGGKATLEFDYRVVAKRKGFESRRLVDVTDAYRAEQQAALRHAEESGKQRAQALAAARRRQPVKPFVSAAKAGLGRPQMRQP